MYLTNLTLSYNSLELTIKTSCKHVFECIILPHYLNSGVIRSWVQVRSAILLSTIQYITQSIYDLIVRFCIKVAIIEQFAKDPDKALYHDRPWLLDLCVM